VGVKGAVAVWAWLGLKGGQIVVFDKKKPL